MIYLLAGRVQTVFLLEKNQTKIRISSGCRLSIRRPTFVKQNGGFVTSPRRSEGAARPEPGRRSSRGRAAVEWSCRERKEAGDRGKEHAGSGS